MASPLAAKVRREREPQRTGSARRSRLLGFAAVVLAAGCLIGGAAGRPANALAHASCNPADPLPSRAALRACVGFTLPKESVRIEEAANGVVTLHAPFDVSTTLAVGHKSNAECQHEGAACVFHHWEWGGEFLEDIFVSGCAPNDPVCKVDLDHQGFGAKWAIVTVELDDNNLGNEVAFVVSSNAPPPEPKKEGSLAVALTTSATGGKLDLGATASATVKVSARTEPSARSPSVSVRRTRRSRSPAGRPD